MASFVLSFFPLDVLDGIWDLIESVSEGFLTYSYIHTYIHTYMHTYILFKLNVNLKIVATAVSVNDCPWTYHQ